jgi:biopolymer transport protein ExbB
MLGERKILRLLAALCLLLPILMPTTARAWWNQDWKQRTVVTLNTSGAGVPLKESLNNIVIPVRLHSGNFDFVDAKTDGSDLRAVAGDDKTALKFWIERFDGVNELAVLWVVVPAVLPGTDKNTIYIYGGNDKATADANSSGAPASVVDASTLAVFHFNEKDGIAVDQSGAIKAAAPTALEPNGLLGQSARLSGMPIVWPENDKLRIAADQPFSVLMWVRPDAAQGTLLKEGPLELTLTNGKLEAKVGATTVSGAAVTPATWSQIALTFAAGKATLYLNGESAGDATLTNLPALSGELRVGEGYQGLIDELQIANVARSAEWIRLTYAAESADAKLIASKTETAGAEKSTGSNSYFGVLFKSLTPDAWAIIIILGVMFLIAVAVMVSKSLYVSRTAGANRRFLKLFRETEDVLMIGSLEANVAFRDSSLYRLYCAGLNELVKRKIGQGNRTLSGPSLDALKAAVDADSVREGYQLNSMMVLLTIAISGGPFLGLLGTVVGVMITFASIAAAGDVNVNAIAPGIAAALLATVAGLGVAIPSLFGYNYLASRIKNIASDMQIFIDEFVTRVAEAYGAQ